MSCPLRNVVLKFSNVSRETAFEEPSPTDLFGGRTRDREARALPPNGIGLRLLVLVLLLLSPCQLGTLQQTTYPSCKVTEHPEVAVRASQTSRHVTSTQSCQQVKNSTNYTHTHTHTHTHTPSMDGQGWAVEHNPKFHHSGHPFPPSAKDTNFVTCFP